MAETLTSCFGLNSTDIETIPEELKQKIVIGADNLSAELAKWKDAVERNKVDQEQLICEYVCKLDETVTELEQHKGQLSTLKSEFQELDDKYQHVSTNRDELKEKYNESSLNEIEQRKKIGALETERDSLADQVRKRIEERELLIEERNSQKQTSEEVRQKQLELQVKLEELLSKEASFKSREERWETERKSLEKQNDWLEQQLREKSEQVLNSRKDLSAKLLHLESELQIRTNELSHSREVATTLQSTVDKLAKSNEEYINRLRESHEEHIKMEELFQNEIQSQKRLIELYKDKADNSESKDKELISAVSEMQNVIKVAANDYDQLKSTKDEEINALQKQIEEYLSTIDKITRELDDANQLLEKFRVRGVSEEDLRKLNPSAAAALNALKRGRTLTQVYTDYMQVMEEKENIALEKQRLEEYVKTLMTEIEERGPVLRRRLEEFNLSQVSLDEKTSQLDQVMNQLVSLQADNEELTRKSNYYQRENKRYKLTCTDLSKQVRVLLKEVEVVRGGSFRFEPDADEMNVSSSGAGDVNVSGSDVISSHLVTFRSIGELQEQNQKMMEVVRELTERLEKTESQMSGDMVTDLQRSLSEVREQVEHVRRCEQMARHQLELVTKQRDMYKVLVEQGEHQASSRSLFAATSSHIEAQMTLGTPKQTTGVSVSTNVTPKGPLQSSDETLRRLEETSDALRELQSEFRKYRENKMDSDKVYNDTVDQLRKDNSELRLLNAKLSSQLDFTHEKFKVLETNVVNYKKEIQVLREMTQTYTTTMAKQEAQLTASRDQLVGQVDRLSQLEVEVANLRAHNTSLKSMEGRMREEVEEGRRQQHAQRQLMANLQAIQSNLEQRDSSERLQLNHRTETLQRELDGLQREMAREHESIKEQKALWLSQLKDVQAELAKERTQAQEAKERIRQKEKEVQAEIEAEKQTSAAVPSTQTSTTSVEQTTESEKEKESDDVASDQRRLLQLKLRDTERERDGLQQTVSRLTTQLAEYRAISESVEERLAEQDTITSQLESQFQIKIKDEAERCEFLQRQLELQEKERQTLVNENIKTSEEAHAMNADLRRQLLQAQHDLQEAIRRREEALSVEAGAKSEIDKHVQMTREANDKYQRELMLHAADVEALDTMKKELSILQSTHTTSREEIKQAQDDLRRLQETVTSKEDQWRGEKNDMDSTITELKEQNNQLQEQIFKLSGQVLSLKKLTDGSANVNLDNEDLKTSEQLMQLVKYLRQQKEIAEAGSEMSAAELARCQRSLSSLDRQLRETRSQLDQERRLAETAVESAQQHAALMQRVDQLNLVTESNRLLRQESETLKRTLKETETRAEALKSSIEPLQEQLRLITEERDGLQEDRKSVELEKNRWKDRCSKLIESSERMDPELYKKACAERDELTEKLASRDKEIKQTSEALRTARQELGQVETRRQQLELILRTEVEKTQKVDGELKTQIQKYDQQEKLLAKNASTISQLREIARRYKTEAQREASQDKKLQDDLNEAKEALESRTTELTATRDELAKMKEETQTVNNRLSSLDTVYNEIKNLLNLDASISVDDLVPRAKDLMISLRQENSDLTAKVSRLQEEMETTVREKTLRLQMIEPQLQKLLKENAEMKRALTAAPSAPVAPSAVGGPGAVAGGNIRGDSGSGGSGMSDKTGASMATLSDDDHSSTSHRVSPCPLSTLSPTITPTPTPRAAASVPPTPVLSCTVQPSVSPPVQSSPSLAVATSNSGSNLMVTGPRQTAEIRPMPSVATVMPTPAQAEPQEVSTAHLQMSQVVSVSLPASDPVPAPSDTPSYLFSVPSAAVPAVSAVPPATPSDQISTDPSLGTSTGQQEAGTTGVMRSGIGKRRRDDLGLSSQGAGTSSGSTVEGSEAKRIKSVVPVCGVSAATPVETESPEEEDIGAGAEGGNEEEDAEEMYGDEEDSEGAEEEDYDDEGEGEISIGEDEDEEEDEGDEEEEEEEEIYEQNTGEVIEISSSDNGEDGGDAEDDLEQEEEEDHGDDEMEDVEEEQEEEEESYEAEEESEEQQMTSEGNLPSPHMVLAMSDQLQSSSDQPSSSLSTTDSSNQKKTEIKPILWSDSGAPSDSLGPSTSTLGASVVPGTSVGGVAPIRKMWRGSDRGAHRGHPRIMTRGGNMSSKMSPRGGMMRRGPKRQ